MKAGAKGGLQYHRLKDEAGVMVSGEMAIRYREADGSLSCRIVGAGDVFHFPNGSVHQGEALTDCVYIEASTPHFNDRVHVDGDESGGLPSTRLEDIVSA